MLHVLRGPEGASYRIIVLNRGFLDLVDTGRTSKVSLKGTASVGYEININGHVFTYEGEGEVHLTFNDDGSFLAAGKGKEVAGMLKPLPPISSSDAHLIVEMMKLKLIPYQSIPDAAPGKPPAEIERLGRQFFPFTQYSRQLAYSIYDYTLPSFLRIVLFKFFSYTKVGGDPLDQTTIADVIWNYNSPPCTPQDKDYMHSFLMVPAQCEKEVHDQLKAVHERLHTYCGVQNRILEAAFYAMPRSSVFKVPQLFSGQPDISNLGLDRFPAEFSEYPGDAGPVSIPMRMPFQAALQTIFKAGSTITAKGVLSFTEHRDYALQYSNGILLVANPAPHAVIWENANYITDLSDDPQKNEYCFPPGSKFLIKDVKKTTFDRKEVYVFTMVAVPA